MSQSSPRKSLALDWLQHSLDSDNDTTTEPHVVDDDDLMAGWENGLLTNEELITIQGHLVGCRHCRNVIGQLVRTGALRLGAETMPVDAPMKAATPRISDRVEQRDSRWHFGRRAAVWTILATAATILMLDSLATNLLPPRQNPIAMAQLELSRGQHRQAYDRMLDYLRSNPEAGQTVEALGRFGSGGLLSITNGINIRAIRCCSDDQESN